MNRSGEVMEKNCGELPAPQNERTDGSHDKVETSPPSGGPCNDKDAAQKEESGPLAIASKRADVGGMSDDVLAEFTFAEPPPAVNVPDPATELDAYKSDVTINVVAKRITRVTALEVRKPNDQEYIRVKPGEERVLLLFRSKADGDKLYLIKRGMEVHLPPKSVRLYRIVLAKSYRALVPFLWALVVPQDDMGRTWHESGEAVAREAETTWVKIVPDGVGHCYVAFPAAGQLAEPEWPTEGLDSLILLAFRNQRVDSPNHPVIRRQKGEAD